MKNFEFEGIEIKTIEELKNLEEEKIYTDEYNEERVDNYQLTLKNYLHDTLYSMITENDEDYNEEILEYILIDYEDIFDVERRVNYVDLEKGYESGNFIFEIKDKYCSIDFCYSSYNGTEVNFDTTKEVQRKSRIEYYYE